MLSRTSRAFLITALMALLVFGAFAAPAFAAPTANWSYVEVRWINESGGPAVLVGGELPASTKLPAAVQLAVPGGASISWAGELLGGDPSKDPTVQYTTQPAGAFDRISFTLTKATKGQVEYAAPQSVTTNGQQKTVSLDWTSPADVPQVNLTVQTPTGATVGDKGGASQSGADTYTKQFTNVKAGQQLKLSLSYTGGTIAPAGGQAGGQTGGTAATAGSSSSSGLITVLVLVLIGVIVAIIVIAKRGDAEPAETAAPQKRAAAPTRRTPAREVDPDDDSPFIFDDDEPEPEPAPKQRVKSCAKAETRASGEPKARVEQKRAAKPEPAATRRDDDGFFDDVETPAEPPAKKAPAKRKPAARKPKGDKPAA